MTTSTGATTAPTKTTSTATPSLYQQAANLAQQQYNAAAQPILGQQAASDAYYNQLGTNAIGSANAAAQMLQSLAPNLQGIYDTAAQNQSLVGNAAAAGMQDAVQGNNSGLNALLDRIGAPAQIDTHPLQAGDVLKSVGGALPAERLVRQGASQAGYLAQLPGFEVMRGVENQRATAVSGAAAHSALDAKLADLAAKLPGDTLQNYKFLTDLAITNKKFALAVQKQNFTEALNKAKFAQQQWYQGQSIKLRGASLQLQGQRLQIAAQRFALDQWKANQQLKVDWARIGIAQKSLQLRIAANAFKQAHGGYTPYQVKRFNQKLDALEASAAPTHGVPGPNGKAMPSPQYQDAKGKWHNIVPGVKIPKGAPTRGTTTYTDFVKAALAKGVPLQLVLQRANKIWPATERGDLGALAQLPALAAQQQAQMNAYNATVGAPSINKAQARYLQTAARSRGLDSRAVLAVAMREGLGGGIGDQGTSFGPWQMHVGGVFPRSVWDQLGHDPQKANEWAWSAQGIDYALNAIARVARGLKGRAAIEAIVRRFERPANPDAEVLGAWSNYQTYANF